MLNNSALLQYILTVHTSIHFLPFLKKLVPKLTLIFFQNAMKVMCLTDEEISDVLQVISGVLQLGNVHFMAAGGAQIAEKSGMLTSFLFKMF